MLGHKVRNWNVDDELNRDWMKFLVRLQQPDSQQGEKAEGRFITKDEQRIFIGGPGSGAGGMTTAGGPTDEQEAKHSLLVRLTKNMSSEQAAVVYEAVADVPLSDLQGLDAIDVTGSGIEIGVEGLKEDRGSLLYKNSHYGWMPAAGAYLSPDSGTGERRRIILDQNSGMTRNVILHELGHHVTYMHPQSRKLRDGANTCVNDLREYAMAGRLKALGRMGLRKYSLTNGEEFLADVYQVRRNGTPEQWREITKFWGQLNPRDNLEDYYP